jgi:hypothetical protein
MTDLTATPETGTVDAPASMDSILAEFETGEPAPAAATEAVVQELVEDAEEGQPEEGAETEDDTTDAEDTGEETAEEEPENEDAPEPTFKVKVAGEEVEVPLSELQRGYSREQDYTRKTMALAEERKTLQSQFASELEQHVKLFEALDPILSEAKAIDWPALAQRDPALYVQLQAAVSERQNAVTEAKAKIAQAQAGDPKAEAEQSAEIAQRETTQLIAKAKEAGLADLSDPAAMSSFAQNAVGYLRGTGFEDGEIRDLTDHRALLIVDKARRYDEIQAAKAKLPAKKVVPKPAAKALTTDGSHSSPAPKTRFPAHAPRERQLEHVVSQFLKE